MKIDPSIYEKYGFKCDYSDIQYCSWCQSHTPIRRFKKDGFQIKHCTECNHKPFLYIQYHKCNNCKIIETQQYCNHTTSFSYWVALIESEETLKQHNKLFCCTKCDSVKICNSYNDDFGIKNIVCSECGTNGLNRI